MRNLFLGVWIPGTQMARSQAVANSPPLGSHVARPKRPDMMWSVLAVHGSYYGITEALLTTEYHVRTAIH